MTNADYIRALRPLLPAEAFRPNTRAYFVILLHVSVVVAGWIIAMHVTREWWPVVGIGVAVSMSSLTFLSHDLSHGTITTNRYLWYPTELVVFSLLFLPPTLWRKVHRNHHTDTNAENDPDRRFTVSEVQQGKGLAAMLLFPNKVLRYNPTCFLYWVLFPFRHGVLAFFYRNGRLPFFATARPRYLSRDLWWIAFEIAFIATVQLSLLKLLGHKSAAFWVSLAPVIVASIVVSWYELTNHGLKPIGNGRDILGATTSVTVPGFCNVLHSNFSYHVEHHLFPAMNPRYYPLVSDLFRKHFPDRYHCVPISQAWGALLRNNMGSAETGARRAADKTQPSGPVAASAQPVPRRAADKMQTSGPVAASAQPMAPT